MPIVAIAGVGAIIIAFLALLVALGAQPLANIISAPLSHLPLVGHKVAGYVNAFIVATSGAIQVWASVLFATATWFLWSVISTVWVTAESIVNGLVKLKTDIVNDATTTAQALGSLAAGLNAAIPALRSYTRTEVGDLSKRLRAANDRIWKAVAAAPGVAEAWAKTNIHNLGDQLRTTIANLSGALSKDLAAIRKTALADLVEARTYTRTEVKGLHTIVSAEITGRVDDAINAIDRAAKDAMVGPWNEMLEHLGTIAGAVPTRVSQVLNLPKILSEPVPVSIPGILGLVVPAIAAVAAETAECGVPICGGLHDLANDFAALEKEAILVLLYGWLIWAARHPVQGAQDIEDILGGPVQDVSNEILRVVGIF